MKMHPIRFEPSCKEILGEEGKSVLEASRMAGVYIPSDCNGKGQCGHCRVRLMEGDVAPFAEEEFDFLSPVEREQGYRLACRAQIQGEAAFWVPGDQILDSGPSKKGFSQRLDRVDPAVKSYCLDLPGETKNDGLDFEIILGLLQTGFGLKNLTAGPALLKDIAGMMGEGRGQVTAVVWMDQEIIDLRPGWDKTNLGLAIDIGTTTVAVYLCNLSNGEVIAEGAVTNPQILFGTDIMSRIAYSVNHPGDGVGKMRQELLKALNSLIDRMSAQSGYAHRHIVDSVVVGNTVMHHIFLGMAPDSLGLWPFTPQIKDAVNRKAGSLGLHVHPLSYVHVLPVEAGFVGADNVGVLLSEEPHHQEECSLIIDLGTNGEIVLGNRERLLSASCATGPAFEGAHIACGMRAQTGAIEKVRINPNDLVIDYQIVGREGWAGDHPPGALQPAGICGSGIIDALAQLFKAGVVNGTGAFSETPDIPRLRKGPSGVMEFVLVRKEETATGQDIVLTQKDIRQIQLAKGALQGGCRVLLEKFGLESVSRLQIAGAFGLNIDKENALALGLFSFCDPQKITCVGNAAGRGAYLALLDIQKRKEAEEIAGRVTPIDLAGEEAFQREFLKALSIPHPSPGD